MNRMRWIVALAVCALVACGRKETVRPVGGTSAITKSPVEAAAATPAATTSGPRDVHVEAFRLGRAFGPDGQVSGEGRSFVKGDKVFVSFAIRDAASGGQARIVWLKEPGDTKVAQDSKPLPPDPGFVSFTVDPAAWGNGEYLIEMWLDASGAAPRRLGTANFTIGASRSRG